MTATATVAASQSLSPAQIAALLQQHAIPRLTLTPEEAARSIGCSRDFFDEHIKPDLRVIRRGRLVLIPVRELERWTDENAAKVMA